MSPLSAGLQNDFARRYARGRSAARRRLGRQAGLRYVYAGNLPGRVQDLEDTRCHQCGELLIERRGYSIGKYAVTARAIARPAHTPVPGRWAKKFDGQIAALPFSPRRRA